jgi:DNA topoisomerase-3
MGCDFIYLIRFNQKNIRKNQYLRLQGSTVNLKDFKTDARILEGLFDQDFQNCIGTKKNHSYYPTIKSASVLCCLSVKRDNTQGKAAYGCSNHRIRLRF